MRDGNEVPRDDVASMFDDIAPVYDRLNTVMTLGARLWRWRRGGGVRATAWCRGRLSRIDVAWGTGKVAAALAERVGPLGHVLGVDLLPAMVARASETLYRDMVQLEFVSGNALALPGERRRVRRGDDLVRPPQPRRFRGRVSAELRSGRAAGRDRRLPRAHDSETARVGPSSTTGCSGACRPDRRRPGRPPRRVPLPAHLARWVPAASRPTGRDDAARRTRRCRLAAARARDGRPPHWAASQRADRGGLKLPPGGFAPQRTARNGRPNARLYRSLSGGLGLGPGVRVRNSGVRSGSSARPSENLAGRLKCGSGHTPTRRRAVCS